LTQKKEKSRGKARKDGDGWLRKGRRKNAHEKRQPRATKEGVSLKKERNAFTIELRGNGEQTRTLQM